MYPMSNNLEFTRFIRRPLVIKDYWTVSVYYIYTFYLIWLAVEFMIRWIYDWHDSSF